MSAQFIKSKTMQIRDHNKPILIHDWQQMRPRAWHHLDELFAGSCDGMTYEEIEEVYPEEFARSSEDKLAYRYPRGESYLDVIARLEPMIIEMERHREPLLIVGHQGILRIIYAFYMGLSRAEAPYVNIPLNNVVECKPGAFSCTVNNHKLYHIDSTKQVKDGQDEPITQSSNTKGIIRYTSPLDDGVPLSSVVEPATGINKLTLSGKQPKYASIADVNNPHSH